MIATWDPPSLLRVAVEPQTYRNAVFLATRLPLGILYFVVFFSMTAFGFSLLWVLVGIPLLALTLAVVWGFARFERDLARWLLRVEMPPMSFPQPPGLTLWRRLWAHLGSAITWKSLAYVLLQLPVGAIVFSLQTALLAAALTLSLVPIAYLVDGLTYTSGGGNFDGLVVALSGAGAGFRPVGAAAAVALGLAGFGLFLLALHVMNGAALAWAAAARQMLSLSDSELRLGEARLQAASEHSRAERADQSRRELVANVSHELRTPLASIQAHVESLTTPERGRPSPADTDRYLNVIARETERLSSLVDDLLVVSGADSGGLRLTKGPIAVAEVLDHVHSALAPLARRERHVTLVKSLPEQPLPAVLADRDRLIQVLMNLGRNACSYTQEGGIVSIEAVPAARGGVAISVSDTGMGISPEELQRVFERFYRTDASRARSTGGFGLGLSIARDLIEAMGGTLTAQSEVGVGSRFTVWLPAAPSQGA